MNKRTIDLVAFGCVCGLTTLDGVLFLVTGDVAAMGAGMVGVGFAWILGDRVLNGGANKGRQDEADKGKGDM